MKLSKRLETVSDLIVSLKSVETIADIGSDHGLLPAYLILEGIVKEAFASDVAKGPYEALLQTISHYHLENKIIPCFGNGLEPLFNYDKHYDVICICGMGANLMVDILKQSIDKISFSYLILQANVDENYLREYLFSNGFCIVDEKIVNDANHCYEIIVAKFGEQTFLNKETDILFGPFLRKEKNAAFIKKWKRELELQEKILVSIPKNHPKYQQIYHRIELIKHAIKY